MNGLKLAELHLRFNQGRAPYLTDSEIVYLENGLREISRFMCNSGYKIETRYFSMEHETVEKTCIARELPLSKED